MLTKRTIAKMPVGAKVCEGDGLYFRKTKPGTGHWSYRYTSSGRAHEIGLGTYPLTDLLKARKLRDVNRRLRSEGKDPVTEKRKAQKLKLVREHTRFSDIAEDYIQRQEPQWRNEKSAQAWRNTLAKYAYPVLDQWPLSEITVNQVLEVLNPIWNKKSVTARLVQQRISNIFDAASARGQFEGENPASWDRRLQYLLPSLHNRAVKHHAAMNYRDIPDLFYQLAEHQCLSARALEFTILTAARTREVILAERREFSLEEAQGCFLIFSRKRNFNYAAFINGY